MKNKAEKDWYSMINRCSSNYKASHPSYKNCYVDVRFEDKQYFVNWHSQQLFAGCLDEKGNSYHLDKEVLVPGNTRYGPDTCVFIPAIINSFYSFIDSDFNDSIGATKNQVGGRWSASMNCWPLHNSRVLGRNYESKEEAHAAYCTAKDEHARFLAKHFRDKVDNRVIAALNSFSTREQIECYAKNKL